MAVTRVPQRERCIWGHRLSYIPAARLASRRLGSSVWTSSTARRATRSSYYTLLMGGASPVTTISWSPNLGLRPMPICSPVYIITRLFLHSFCEPPSPQELAITLHPYLASSPTWDVFIYGFWYPSASSAENLLVEERTHTSGCSAIFASALSPLTTGVLVLRKDVRDLLLSGGPRMMELAGGVAMVTIHLYKLGQRVGSSA